MTDDTKPVKKFTTKEQAFIDCLFDPDVCGDINKAKTKAGYADSTESSHILRRNKHVAEAVIEQTNQYIALNAAKGAHALVEAIDKPTTLGLGKRLKAADSLLDRAGLAKKQQVEIEVNDDIIPILLLPAKKVDPYKAEE